MKAHHWFRAFAGLAAVILILAGPASAQHGDVDSHYRGRGHRPASVQPGLGGTSRVGESSQPRGGAPVVIKMRRYSVPQPHVIQNPSHVVTERRMIPTPRTYEGGARIEKRPATLPPSHHTTVVRDAPLVRNIVERQRVEVVPRRFYWHQEHGVRYAHYYDEHFVHWYGFYHGPSFYWCRYNAGYWWWWDLHFGRWVYWSDGFWWWPGPARVAYVYVDNSYYPYEEGVVTVKQPLVQPPPAAEPGALASAYYSPNNRRMVQLVGTQGDAFLYDKTGAQPEYIKYLGTGVERIRFSGGTNERPIQILAEFKDGAFALFDADGNPLDAPSSPAATSQPAVKATPPPQPESLPPPPDSAPGQTPKPMPSDQEPAPSGG